MYVYECRCVGVGAGVCMCMWLQSRVSSGVRGGGNIPRNHKVHEEVWSQGGQWGIEEVLIVQNAWCTDTAAGNMRGGPWRNKWRPDLSFYPSCVKNLSLLLRTMTSLWRASNRNGRIKCSRLVDLSDYKMMKEPELRIGRSFRRLLQGFKWGWGGLL